jgi:hypothetical protein
MLDDDIPVHRPACLDLYNPENLFRVPTLKELVGPGQCHGVGGGIHHGVSRTVYLRDSRPAFSAHPHAALRHRSRQPEPLLRHLVHRQANSHRGHHSPPHHGGPGHRRALGPPVLEKAQAPALVFLHRHAETGVAHPAPDHHRLRMRPGGHRP